MTLRQELRETKKKLKLSEEKIEIIKIWGCKMNHWPTDELVKLLLQRLKNKILKKNSEKMI